MREQFERMKADREARENKAGTAQGSGGAGGAARSSGGHGTGPATTAAGKLQPRAQLPPGFNFGGQGSTDSSMVDRVAALRRDTFQRRRRANAGGELECEPCFVCVPELACVCSVCVARACVFCLCVRAHGRKDYPRMR
jgi:hypothetical protein